MLSFLLSLSILFLRTAESETPCSLTTLGSFADIQKPNNSFSSKNDKVVALTECTVLSALNSTCAKCFPMEELPHALYLFDMNSAERTTAVLAYMRWKYQRAGNDINVASSTFLLNDDELVKACHADRRMQSVLRVACVKHFSLGSSEWQPKVLKRSTVFKKLGSHNALVASEPLVTRTSQPARAQGENSLPASERDEQQTAHSFGAPPASRPHWEKVLSTPQQKNLASQQKNLADPALYWEEKGRELLDSFTIDTSQLEAERRTKSKEHLKELLAATTPAPVARPTPAPTRDAVKLFVDQYARAKQNKLAEAEALFAEAQALASTHSGTPAIASASTSQPAAKTSICSSHDFCGVDRPLLVQWARTESAVFWSSAIWRFIRFPAALRACKWLPKDAEAVNWTIARNFVPRRDMAFEDAPPGIPRLFLCAQVQDERDDIVQDYWSFLQGYKSIYSIIVDKSVPITALISPSSTRPVSSTKKPKTPAFKVYTKHTKTTRPPRNKQKKPAHGGYAAAKVAGAARTMHSSEEALRDAELTLEQQLSPVATNRMVPILLVAAALWCLGYIAICLSRLKGSTEDKLTSTIRTAVQKQIARKALRDYTRSKSSVDVVVEMPTSASPCVVSSTPTAASGIRERRTPQSSPPSDNCPYDAAPLTWTADADRKVSSAEAQKHESTQDEHSPAEDSHVLSLLQMAWSKTANSDEAKKRKKRNKKLQALLRQSVQKEQ